MRRSTPRRVAGLVETVPTYRSLMVQFDPLVFDYDAFERRVRALAATLDPMPKPGRRWKVPVVYGGKFGIDLEATAERHGLTPTQLIDKHMRARLPRLHDRLHAGLHLSRRARSVDRHAAPHRSAAA